jgi:F-box protein, helicase, 18
VKPTEEQQAILDATGRVLLINARAGTGKTTTLRMIASAHPDKKVLYLVFNRKAREEAEGKFPRNVEVRTVHSLAYSKSVGEVENFSIADMLPAFKGHSNPQQLAAVSHDLVEFFMNSPFPKVEEAMEVFQEDHLSSLSEEIRDLVEDARDRIVQAAREILGQWYRKERPYPHDFYLKLFHREGGFDQALGRFDRVLVDEGQDLSPIMLDALSRCQRRIVIVGDTHQQIYSFRYAIDAMKRFPFDDTRDLTLSFRFGKTIADLASVFIREAKGEKGFRIRGNPDRSSKVSFYTAHPRPKAGERCAVLSRTNLALFEHALGLRATGIPFSLQGNIAGILGRILDVYRLSEGEHDKIRDPLIRSFENLEDLETYASDLDDFQLTNMVHVVREYARVLPDAVFDIMKISKTTADNPKGPGVILSTVHGAKGQEYDRVYIDADIAASLSRPEALVTPTFGDEANIAYVGFTRAIRHLYLPPDFKDILTPEWQTALKRYEPPAPPKIAHGPRAKPSRTELRGFSVPRHAPLPPKTPEPKPPRKKRFKIGDRVKTSHGTGTVVEMDGEKYLVDLDGQGARLWTKDWALRKD